jgi:hypothetical protein
MVIKRASPRREGLRDTEDAARAGEMRVIVLFLNGDECRPEPKRIALRQVENRRVTPGPNAAQVGKFAPISGLALLSPAR